LYFASQVDLSYVTGEVLTPLGGETRPSKIWSSLWIRRQTMGEDSGSGSTGVVAILVIFVIVVVVGLVVFGGRIFSGNKQVDVNITTPSR
jgi:hypothetical protein